MRLSDGVYNFIRWFSLIFIPAAEVLILTVGKIWSIPYYTEIGATIAAVGVFLAAVIGVSSRAYYDALTSGNGEEYYEELDQMADYIDPALLDVESEVE